VVETFDIRSLRKRLLPESTIPEAGKRGAPEAAVAIILDPNNEEEAILFIRRTEREGDPWSGQIAFPGGHKRSNDRDLRETAVREAEEEVGVDLRKHELLGVLPPTYAHTRQMLVVPFVFQLKNHIDVRANEEVAESFWVALRHLVAIKASKAKVYTQHNEMMVEAYICNGHVIWGLTFGIVNALLGRETVN
jgi:8-oxo-dGTP pyrophosphatase MutT (NUDIX family)